MNKEIPPTYIKAFFTLFFLIFLGTSIAFIATNADKHNRRILFFYNDIAKKVIGKEVGIRAAAKTHQLNKKSSLLEQAVTSTVERLFYPPENIEWRPFFANQGKLSYLGVVGSICYIDVAVNSFEAIQKGGDFRADFVLLRKTVLFNFPQIEQVIITVNGQQPYVKPYIEN